MTLCQLIPNFMVWDNRPQSGQRFRAIGVSLPDDIVIALDQSREYMHQSREYMRVLTRLGIVWIVKYAILETPER